MIGCDRKDIRFRRVANMLDASLNHESWIFVRIATKNGRNLKVENTKSLYYEKDTSAEKVQKIKSEQKESMEKKGRFSEA